MKIDSAKLSRLSSLRSLVALSCLFSYLFLAAAYSGDVPTAEQPAAPADSIFDETLLDDLEIVGQRRLVQSDGATLTYNVSEDPEAGSSNVLDILRKVPGVTVDAEDNVRVNGQTNFKILVNNRQDPMFSGDIKTVLKSMPASSIRKIEVISEPGAKYDAEGGGGILNIVTDTSSRLQGFSATLSAWMSNQNIGASANVRRKLGNVMLGIDLSYNNSLFKRPAYRNTKIMEDLTTDPPAVMTSRTESRTRYRYFGPKISLSWEPDTLNLFTFSVRYGLNPWNVKGREDRWKTDPEGAREWSLIREESSPNHYNSTSAQASYQHNFRRPDHTLTLSYLIDWGESETTTVYNTIGTEGALQEPPYSEMERSSISRTHVVQTDYSNKLGRHLIEAGAKANLDDTPQVTWNSAGDDSASAVVDEESRVAFSQFKDIYALYGSYTGSFGRWSLKAGLRFEHTRIGLKYRVGDYPDFTSRLNDWVPNGAVSYNISDASTLRLAYGMRISRPNVYYLNPFVNDLTPGMVTYGNPDLDSQKTHNLSLGYTNYAGRLSGGLKVSYAYIANSITDVIFMRDGVMNTTYANVGKQQMINTDGNISWKITDALDWSVYAAATWTRIRANALGAEQRKSGWQSYVSSDVSWQMPSKIRMSAYGGYYTPWIDLQSRGSDGYYYGLGFSRSFLVDDALTLKLSASNFLRPKRSNHYTQESETARLSYRGEYSTWYVGFSVSFRFGALKADVKKTAASVETESSSAGGSKK